MADSHGTQGGHPAMDYAEHERTYEGFLHFTMIGTLWCVGVLVCLAIGVTGKSWLWAGLMSVLCTAGAMLGLFSRGMSHYPISAPLALSVIVWAIKAAH